MTEHPVWGDKPYRSLDYEMKQRFGEKVYKIALSGGMTCPNRDGTLDTRGCIFCSGSGSGDFAMMGLHTVTEQINQGIRFLSQSKKTGHRYTAYFQSFTNTYAPLEQLTALYHEALAHPDVAMLSVATRPDCLPADVITLLQECNRIKPVMVELGLQTIHENTACYIRRGYSTAVYDTAVESLINAGLGVVTHVIAGLPGESKKDFLQSVSHVTEMCVNTTHLHNQNTPHTFTAGIKLQLLHVLTGTDLAEDYKNGMFSVLTMDEYLDWIISAIQILPEEMVIHRLTGDGPKHLLLAPLWSRNKRMVLNTLHKIMREKHIYQGQSVHNGEEK